MWRWCSWRFSISVLLVYVIHEFRGLLRVLNQQVFLPVGLMGAAGGCGGRWWAAGSIPARGIPSDGVS